MGLSFKPRKAVLEALWLFWNLKTWTVSDANLQICLESTTWENEEQVLESVVMKKKGLTPKGLQRDAAILP